eukprot:TRINITY_DN1417_c0_g1_i1.p1 TRINITY_DN1417_c0_g1~~TRINITY_DN1417_c0_g1_i1.p1  ORF type:complete len:333 (-),score=78.40 TRINITY_DN1417_c0_g1_i1:183-1181(-)
MSQAEIQEIRRLQAERAAMSGDLVSLSAHTLDKQFYGGEGEDYESSIPVMQNDIDEEDEEFDQRYQQEKRLVNTFTAPKSIMDEMEEAGAKDEEDPFKDYRKLTIAEREGEYRGRWRKRATLSPPRIDPLSKSKEDPSKVNSYRDIMINAQLDRERAEVLRKIQQKQRDDRDVARKEERRIKYEKKKEEKRRRRGDHSRSRSRSRSRSPSDRSSTRRDATPEYNRGTKEGWKLEMTKNGVVMETIELESDATYSCGRTEDADIRLDHASCSKNHAKISFVSQGRPSVMDLNSTNGTFLNGTEMTPAEWYKLSDGDTVKFGCSTRDFKVKEVR